MLEFRRGFRNLRATTVCRIRSERAPYYSGSLLPTHRSADAECAELQVWPVDEVLATCRLHAVEKIDLDVDPVEARGDSGR
ncbi:hypothetical protein OHA33_32190 [Streptomyces sp. NBC_00562]|uniref:hypothetical protein n=1 Tax=Streptomyces sp. NBC_00562 TaxID=2975777 RepID=UPI002E809CEE|nr:hypothetical protein [Streptomyces sp. NBC_00562]WUC23153.1 hypothetical protein OHA33_32190 [Streptomyces sp. NBC_00562]